MNYPNVVQVKQSRRNVFHRTGLGMTINQELINHNFGDTLCYSHNGNNRGITFTASLTETRSKTTNMATGLSVVRHYCCTSCFVHVEAVDVRSP